MQWSSSEVNKILKEEEQLLSLYKELSTISQAEWDCRQKEGLHKLLVKKKEDLSQKIIHKTQKCHRQVNPPVPSSENTSKVHWSDAPLKSILTEVSDVVNTSQKTTESQRNTNGSASTPITEKKCSKEVAEAPTPQNVRKELNVWQWPRKDLQRRQNDSKLKQHSAKTESKALLQKEPSNPTAVEDDLKTACTQNTSSYNLCEKPKKKDLTD